MNDNELVVLTFMHSAFPSTPLIAICDICDSMYWEDNDPDISFSAFCVHKLSIICGEFKFDELYTSFSPTNEMIQIKNSDVSFVQQKDEDSNLFKKYIKYYKLIYSKI